jgi:hypothetical protein
MKRLEGATCTARDFAQAKTEIKNCSDADVRRIRGTAQGALDAKLGAIKRTDNLDIALKLSNMVMLPPHDETDRLLSCSWYVKYNIRDASGRVATRVASMTSTLIWVRAKLLFLYAYGTKDDLEWTRTASRVWARKVISDNPSDAVTASRESSDSSIWNGLGTKALSGAIIVVVAGFLSDLRRRRTQHRRPDKAVLPGTRPTRGQSLAFSRAGGVQTLTSERTRD